MRKIVLLSLLIDAPKYLGRPGVMNQSVKFLALQTNMEVDNPPVCRGNCLSGSGV